MSSKVYDGSKAVLKFNGVELKGMSASIVVDAPEAEASTRSSSTREEGGSSPTPALQYFDNGNSKGTPLVKPKQKALFPNQGFKMFADNPTLKAMKAGADEAARAKREAQAEKKMEKVRVRPRVDLDAPALDLKSKYPSKVLKGLKRDQK